MKIAQDGQKWRVTYQLNGKQKRQWFDTKGDAKTFVAEKTKELQRNGTEWLDVPVEERAGLLLVHQQVPAGKRAELVSAFRQAEAGGYRLSEALTFFEQNREHHTNGDTTVAKLVEDCIQSRMDANMRATYIKELRNSLSRYARACGQQKLRQVTAESIEKYLRNPDCLPEEQLKDRPKWAPATRNSYLTNLRTAFQFGVERGWIRRNPAAAVLDSATDDKMPGILTVDEIKRLMEAARQHDPKMCGYISLMVFAGIRPSQLRRMTPEDLDLEAKEVHAVGRQTKSRDNRHVSISENCAAWCKVGMELPPPNWRKRMHRVRTLALIETWPHDCLRHSFGSYHLMMHEDAGKTAYLMGQDSTQTLFANYRALVKKAEAEEFWAIFP